MPEQHTSWRAVHSRVLLGVARKTGKSDIVIQTRTRVSTADLAAWLAPGLPGASPDLIDAISIKNRTSSTLQLPF
jgi:hypothetical protein